MKYDLSKKPTKGAQRTLAAFSNAMYQLVTQKPYEDISINEICQISNFPRATFYNYFDDKNDLINYCWFLFKQETTIDQYHEVPRGELQQYLLDQVFAEMYRHRKFLSALSKCNSEDSQIINSFYQYFRNEAIIILKDRMHADTTVPLELIAEHYSSTILLVLKWIFFEGHPLNKEQAMDYINQLLPDIGNSQ